MPMFPARLRARLRAIRILEPLAERDYALLTTAAVISLLGPGTTMVAGGLVGSVLMGGLLFWPGVRDPDRRPEDRA